MSDSDRTSHWQFLAELLGAKPKSEPEPSSIPEQPPTESLPDSEAIEPKSAPAAQPTPDRAKRSAKTPPRSAPPGRHWGELARSLGIDAPETPEEETHVVEEAQVEPAAEPEPEETSRPRYDAMRDEQRSVAPARDIQPEAADFPSDVPPRDNFLEEVGLVEDTFDAIEEEAAEIARDVEPPPSEESPRSGSRRRRRGRHRRRREGTGESEPDVRESELEPPSSRELERIEEREPVDRDLEETPAQETRPPGPRRRRRRRGGERRGAESRTEDRAERERETHETASRAPSRPARERPPEKSHVRDNDYDEPDDEGDEDFGERRSRRSIPSWSEAVQDIVNLNLAARQKSQSRRPRGGRGRRPNQRDR